MRDVYCDIRFIEELITRQPVIVPFDEKSLNELRCWSDFCELLLRSNLHLNISDIDLNVLINQKDKTTSTGMFFKQLQKRLSNGLCDINCDFDSNSLSDSVPNLNGVYLVCKNRVKSELLSRKFGVLVIPINNYISYSYLFEDGGTSISVKDHNYKNWSLLGKIGSNICNSMMIIDNYLLTDEDKMEENISSILNALLPKQIETTFQLSIFTLLYDQRTGHHKNLQKRYDSILNIIKEIRGNDFKVSLSIFKCQKYRFADPKRFHGRVILTNNVFICSDGGYDLFKNGESTKLAVINIVYPHFSNRISWASFAFDNYLNEAKEESDGSDTYNNQIDDIPGRFLGDKNLRLWEFINRQE